MNIQIIHADVMDGLRQLPDQSVHCVITSPPYWGLRDYGVEGQIGLEKTPEEYVTKMVEVFREVRRVLRDDGTVWLNLGDCYARQGGNANAQSMNDMKDTYRAAIKAAIPPEGFKEKDMVGIPWRVAFALQADGWYLRSDIIWSKPNPMPESVTDRPTKSHEYVFLLTKKASYFYDADAVREELKPETQERYNYGFSGGKREDRDTKTDLASWNQKYDKLSLPAGRNRRTVWDVSNDEWRQDCCPECVFKNEEVDPNCKVCGGLGYVWLRHYRDITHGSLWKIATQPFPAAHFATFPEALVEPCIKAGTSERGCCSVCGAPWVRVVEKEYPETRITKTNGPIGDHGFLGNQRRDDPVKIQTVDWQPSCSCNTDTVPCVVLDPFGGSGTVAKVARDLNRKAILIEINPDYIKIAKERLRLHEQLSVFT